MTLSSARSHAFVSILLFCAFCVSSAGLTPPRVSQNPTLVTKLRVSATSFSFGPVIVGTEVVKQVVQVQNNGAAGVPLNPTLSGSPYFSLVAGQSCPARLPAHAACSMTVRYAPATASGSAEQSATLNLGAPSTPWTPSPKVALSGSSAALPAGAVTPTANPQVALYTINLPFPGAVTVQFHASGVAPHATWTQSSSTAGPVSILVAGMLPHTTYTMTATVAFANGQTVHDVSHTFTTGSLPAGFPAKLAATTAPGMTPQPGVELVNSLIGAIPNAAFATDLDGNIIWTYAPADRQGAALLYPAKLLPNGHLVCLIAAIYPNPAGNQINVLREFDLAGNTVRQVSMSDLNTRLEQQGFSLTLNEFSHDVELLPNGHYLVIANTIKPFRDLPGYPGTTQVAGDVVVDLDQNLQPVWVWNSFDHLDVNRHPYMFPDWTHANSVAYSKDDGNFIISLRHQNWVLKIDYRDGAGTGKTIWTLGPGGDFTLTNGTDPTDWFYAQHDAQFASDTTAGVYPITLFDDGDDRVFPSGTTCGTGADQTPCLYSTIQELQIDEVGRKATFLFHQILPPNLYSYFAGSNRLEPNGDFDYNDSGVGTSAYTFEVAPGPSLDATPQPVWQMSLPGTNTYRSIRIPSLYPGVTW